MRISAKARYGLAAMVYFAIKHPGQMKFTVLEVSEQLGISKIYLEQVFTQLKAGGVVTATKGPQGGYSLSRDPGSITAYDVLSATETALFDPTPATLQSDTMFIDHSISDLVFTALDSTVKDRLSAITLQQLADRAESDMSDGFMCYI